MLSIFFVGALLTASVVYHLLSKGFESIEKQYITITTSPNGFNYDYYFNLDAGKDNITTAFQNMISQIFVPDNHWIDEIHEIVENKAEILVQSIKLLGNFSSYNMPIQRAKMKVYNCSSKSLFDYLTSLDGFMIIDPFTSKSEQMKPPLFEYTTEEDKVYGDIYQVKKGHFPWPINDIDFIVFNMIRKNISLFISNSVTYDLYPIETKSKKRRANLLFGLHAFDSYNYTTTTTDCILHSYNYISNMMTQHPVLLYSYNAKCFYPNFIKRLLKHKHKFSID